MKTLDLSNVRYTSALTDKVNGKYAFVDKLLDPVIQKLALDNPRWEFIATHGRENSTEFMFDQFTIKENGEQLGLIDKSWYRGNYTIRIRNDRIGKERNRGDSYETIDPKKAILKVRKMFQRKTTNEVLESATKKSREAMRSVIRDHEYQLNNSLRTIKEMTTQYILGVGNVHFLNYVSSEDCPAHMKLQVERNTQLIDKLKGELDYMESLNDSSSILIVKNGSNYIVKNPLGVQSYTDDTLPLNLKRKMGILKLVDDSTFVRNVGYRIDENNFIVGEENAEKASNDQDE